MNRKTSIGGIILVALGFLLLLNAFHIPVSSFIVPAALIILGLWLLWRQSHRRRAFEPPFGQSMNYDPATHTYTTTYETTGPEVGTPPPPPSPHEPSAQADRPTQSPHFEAGKVKYSKFLGDMYVDCSGVNLQNIEISMFIGDLHINLKGGKLAQGLNRMVISGFIGDMLVLVPRDIPVFVHTSGFVGDVELLGKRASGFGNTLDGQTPDYDQATAKLYIAANNFIGDIRVYSV